MSQLTQQQKETIVEGVIIVAKLYRKLSCNYDMTLLALSTVFGNAKDEAKKLLDAAVSQIKKGRL